MFRQILPAYENSLRLSAPRFCGHRFTSRGLAFGGRNAACFHQHLETMKIVLDLKARLLTECPREPLAQLASGSFVRHDDLHYGAPLSRVDELDDAGIGNV